MNASVVLDVVLLVVLAAYGLSGLRRGLLAGLLSIGGLVVGALVGMAVVPELVAGWEPGLRRTVVVLIGVLLSAWLVQWLGGVIGHRLRALVTWRPARTADSVLGMVAALVAVAMVTWLVAGAVRASPAPVLARAVAGSTVVSVVDDLVPAEPGRVFTQFRRVVGGDTFPRVFAGLAPEHIPAVGAPDPQQADPAAAAAAGGVVKISGVAEACRRGQEGSGFVVAPERVVTNAHVVAGVDTPTVQVAGTGPHLEGRVVAFDPERDLAVIAVPGLQAPALPLGQDLTRGDPAVVVGFPLQGSYRAEPARVRQVLEARGENIYGEPGAVRQVYSLFTTVEPGNSGGPLLDAGGEVVGVVFARSLDDAETGYALTLAEAAPVLSGAAGATSPVDTGRCSG